MRPILRYVLITATRDRLFFGLLVATLIATGICAVLGSTALLEPERMTLSFTAASSRVIIMIGLMVFVCFHVRHAFETKEIDVLLSRPISRTSIVLGYGLAFAVVATLLVVPVAVILYLLNPLNQTGYALYMLSLLFEAYLVVAIALFASFTLRSGVFSLLASFGFYALSRMIGFFVAIVISPSGFQNEALRTFTKTIMEMVATVMPRLDFFAKSDWLIYGPKSLQDASLFAYQAAIFIPLLLMACILDFTRKQF